MTQNQSSEKYYYISTIVNTSVGFLEKFTMQRDSFLSIVISKNKIRDEMRTVPRPSSNSLTYTQLNAKKMEMARVRA